MKKSTLIKTIAAIFLLQSCATVFTGTKQSITIDSKPQGAEIVMDGQTVGITPSKIKANREMKLLINGGKNIILKKEGFKPYGYVLKSEFNPVSVINLFNAPCWAIDIATGAIMKYNQDYYNFDLIPYNLNE